MQAIKIKKAVNVPIQRVQKLLMRAFDPDIHAVSEWCEIVDYMEPTRWPLAVRLDTTKEICRYADYPVNKGGYVVVKETAGDQVNNDRLKLGLPQIQRGLELMIEKYPDHFNDLMAGRAGNYTADVFVQLALFGEIIYS